MGLVSDSLVTPGPLDEVLSDIARHATALLGASRGSLMLRIPGTQELRMAAAVNIPAEVVSEARARIGEGIAGLCAQRGEPLLIPDVEEAGISHPPEYLSRYENQSAICVPLRFRDEILGVLSLNDRKDGKDFSPDDLFIAEIIASQASIAIWTSRMLEESMQAAATHRSLDVARAIQRSFLPADLERPDVAISTLCISADATGGDYVDCWTMRDADDRETGELVLAIGDATGHGIGSALVSTTCRASLRALFLGDGEIGHVMQHLDRLLERDLRQGRFVTLFLGRLDPASGRLVYSSAGHPPGLLFRDALGPCAELSATGPPLGLGLGGAFPTRELTLRPGDMLAMVTDGVLDARNEAGEVFGAARLAGTLAGLAQAAPRDVVAGLRRRLAGFARPAALADDLSAIVVKLREARASPRPKG
jgi:sigma-B regulation protein RsbU (phosphoserine phosphatase)